MPFSQRILLILGSFVTLQFFIRGIRKNRLKIDHSIFWTVFGLVLLVLACVPNVFFWISRVLGFQSPSNLVYIIVVFLLVLKLFTTTVRLSKLSEQVASLTQELAIYRLETEEQQESREQERDMALV